MTVYTVRYCHGCGLIRPADADSPCPECADEIGQLMAAAAHRLPITYSPQPCAQLDDRIPTARSNP